MKYSREFYKDLVGRYLSTADRDDSGFIERIDVDREWHPERDIFDVWINGRIYPHVSEVKAITEEKIVLSDFAWIDLTDNRKEIKPLQNYSEDCVNCKSSCKRNEICSFYDPYKKTHHYYEVKAFNLKGEEYPDENNLLHWWDATDE